MQNEKKTEEIAVNNSISSDPLLKPFYFALQGATYVRTARKLAGLTQTQLAERLGLSQGRVAQLESEDIEPTLRSLASVAASCGGELRLSYTHPKSNKPIEFILYRDREIDNAQ